MVTESDPVPKLEVPWCFLGRWRMRSAVSGKVFNTHRLLPSNAAHVGPSIVGPSVAPETSVHTLMPEPAAVASEKMSLQMLPTWALNPATSVPAGERSDVGWGWGRDAL